MFRQLTMWPYNNGKLLYKINQFRCNESFSIGGCVAESKPVLHLVCGLPGSGKTTFAKQLENTTQAIRFSPDEWLYQLGLDFYDEISRDKVEQLQWEVAQRLLKQGMGVILENGFWSKQERSYYREIADAIGATTIIHYLDGPIEELKNRLEKRNLTRDSDTPEVNPLNLDEWCRFFEPPTKEELG